MRVEEPIVANGLFWFPGDPDKKSSGTLRISENGEAALEMMDSHQYGLRNIGKGADEPVRILGMTNRAGVTLDGCTITNTNWSMLSQTTFRVQVVYWRVHYEEDEDITFSKVEFSVEHLNEWLHTEPIQNLAGSEDGSEQLITYTSGMSHRWSQNGELSVSYAPPKNVLISLPNDVEMRLCFSYNATTGPFRVNLTAEPYISLESRTECGFDEFLSLIHRICAFLSFSIDRAVSLKSFTGYSEQLPGQRRGSAEQVPVEVYFQSDRTSLQQSELRESDIFLPYEAVENQIEVVLKKWLECYQTDGFEPSLNLYSAVLSQPDTYLEVKFLFFAQALEVLHRRISNEPVMPKAEFRCIKKAMLEVVPKHRRKYFADRLGFLNEPTLKQRLDELVREVQGIYGINSKGRELFVKKVGDTRNYLVHYSRRPKNTTDDNQELFDLTRQLKSLLQLHFLQLIGLDKRAITDLVESNPLYQDRMKRLWQK